ncbi:hypothetical protein LEP3755_29210 [Leptolyngbya sp. NIES-3755]|nr:hypothetical protein LEP3755_29210 [Leptolyngbya sp. NIES-3755]
MQSETHAAIVGGSLAGLLMGRVLADHFDRVTIIERDAYPDQPIPRKGVPHSRFPHTLMIRGQQILESLFPGLRAELIDAGAIELDSLNDLAFLTPAGWAARSASNLSLLSCSRDLLDWSIRRRVATLPNVQFLTETSVRGLLTDTEHKKIIGVSLHQRNAETNTELRADLIVDASGKASHTPDWLRALGYESPPEIEVNAFVGYVARIYQPPADRSIDWKMVFMPAAPPQRHRGGAIFPIEGDRWIISLAGGDRDYPPTNEAGFLAFARTLPSPIIADMIERSTPLTPIYAYYGNENRLRQYDQCSLPTHLIVVGHAACSLNPTYGQAMTVAALEAMTVDRFFQHHAIRNLDTQTHQLQQQLAKAHQEAWSAAIGMDYRYQSTQSQSINATTRFVNWYWEQLMALSLDRASVFRTFLEVLHLIKPSIVLFRPAILVPVLVRVVMQRWQRFLLHSKSKLTTH